MSLFSKIGDFFENILHKKDTPKSSYNTGASKPSSSKKYTSPMVLSSLKSVESNYNNAVRQLNEFKNRQIPEPPKMIVNGDDEDSIKKAKAEYEEKLKKFKIDREKYVIERRQLLDNLKEIGKGYMEGSKNISPQDKKAAFGSLEVSDKIRDADELSAAYELKNKLETNKKINKATPKMEVSKENYLQKAKDVQNKMLAEGWKFPDGADAEYTAKFENELRNRINNIKNDESEFYKDTSNLKKDTKKENKEYLEKSNAELDKTDYLTKLIVSKGADATMAPIKFIGDKADKVVRTVLTDEGKDALDNAKEYVKSHIDGNALNNAYEKSKLVNRASNAFVNEWTPGFLHQKMDKVDTGSKIGNFVADATGVLGAYLIPVVPGRAKAVSKITKNVSKVVKDPRKALVIGEVIGNGLMEGLDELIRAKGIRGDDNKTTRENVTMAIIGGGGITALIHGLPKVTKTLMLKKLQKKGIKVENFDDVVDEIGRLEKGGQLDEVKKDIIDEVAIDKPPGHEDIVEHQKNLINEAKYRFLLNDEEAAKVVKKFNPNDENIPLDEVKKIVGRDDIRDNAAELREIEKDMFTFNDEAPKHVPMSEEDVANQFEKQYLEQLDNEKNQLMDETVAPFNQEDLPPIERPIKPEKVEKLGLDDIMNNSEAMKKELKKGPVDFVKEAVEEQVHGITRIDPNLPKTEKYADAFVAVKDGKNIGNATRAIGSRNAKEVYNILDGDKGLKEVLRRYIVAGDILRDAKVNRALDNVDYESINQEYKIAAEIINSNPKAIKFLQEREAMIKGYLNKIKANAEIYGRKLDFENLTQNDYLKRIMLNPDEAKTFSLGDNAVIDRKAKSLKSRTSKSLNFDTDIVNADTRLFEDLADMEIRTSVLAKISKYDVSDSIKPRAINQAMAKLANKYGIKRYGNMGDVITQILARKGVNSDDLETVANIFNAIDGNGIKDSEALTEGIRTLLNKTQYNKSHSTIREVLDTIEESYRHQVNALDGYSILDTRNAVRLNEAVDDSIVDTVADELIGNNGDNASFLKIMEGDMVVPDEVAKSVKGVFAKKEKKALASAVISTWKRWVLYNPAKFAGFYGRVLSGDIDAVFAGQPGVFKHVGEAQKILSKAKNAKVMDRRLIDFLDRYALDYGQDVAGLRKLQGKKGNVTKYLDFVDNIFGNTEKLKRFSAYLYYEKALQKGDIVYGAANKNLVKGMSSLEDKAFYLSEMLIGDYRGISKTGEKIRDFIPFWNFQEVNFKRYYNIIKNNLDPSIAKEILEAQGKSTKGVMGKIRIGTKTTERALGTFARMNAFALTMSTMNYMFNADVEEKLPAYVKKTTHLIVNYKGDYIVFQNLGALNNFMSWFDFIGSDDERDKLKAEGKYGFEEAVKDEAKAVGNNFIQGLHPLLKAAYERTSGKRLFPDAFNPQDMKLSDRGDGIPEQLLHTTTDFLGLQNFMNPVYTKMYEAGLTNTPGTSQRGGLMKGILGAVGGKEFDPAEENYNDYKYNQIPQFEKDVLDKKGTGISFHSTDEEDYKKSQALSEIAKAAKKNDIATMNAWIKYFKDQGGTMEDLQNKLDNMDPEANYHQSTSNNKNDLRNKDMQIGQLNQYISDNGLEEKRADALKYYEDVKNALNDKAKNELPDAPLEPKDGITKEYIKYFESLPEDKQKDAYENMMTKEQQQDLVNYYKTGELADRYVSSSFMTDFLAASPTKQRQMFNMLSEDEKIKLMKYFKDKKASHISLSKNFIDTFNAADEATQRVMFERLTDGDKEKLIEYFKRSQ